MATSPRIVPSDGAPKQKRRRSASVAKPAFFIIQILDEDGQPTQFDKKRVKLLKVERSAESVMDMVESGDHPYAFYLRGIVPVARQNAPRPVDQTVHGEQHASAVAE